MTISLTAATLTIEARTVPLALKHVKQLRHFDAKWRDDQIRLIGEVFDHTEAVTYTLFDTPEGVQRYNGRLTEAQQDAIGQPQRIILL